MSSQTRLKQDQKPLRNNAIESFLTANSSAPGQPTHPSRTCERCPRMVLTSWWTEEKLSSAISDGTWTVPGAHTLPRSFRSRSTIIKFSARSFSDSDRQRERECVLRLQKSGLNMLWTGIQKGYYFGHSNLGGLLLIAHRAQDRS